MTQKLYLMRHGQTLFNTQGRVQGWCDSPLTETGIEQAKAAKHFFERNGIVFEEAYSSTQERATDTAKLITDLPVIQLKGIKEMNFGVFEGQPEFLQPKRRPGAVSFEDALVPYGGEDIRDVGRRVGATIREVLDNSRAETILMVSHGAAMWGFRIEEGTPWPDGVFLPNCSIIELSYTDKQLTFHRLIDPVTDTIFVIEE